MADAWSASVERDPREGDPLPTLLGIVGVVVAAEQVGRGVYLWVAAA